MVEFICKWCVQIGDLYHLKFTEFVKKPPPLHHTHTSKVTKTRVTYIITDNSTIMYMNVYDVCFGRVRFFLTFTRYDQRTTVLAWTEKLASFHYSKYCNVLKVKKNLMNSASFLLKKLKKGACF